MNDDYGSACICDGVRDCTTSRWGDMYCDPRAGELAKPRDCAIVIVVGILVFKVEWN